MKFKCPILIGDFQVVYRGRNKGRVERTDKGHLHLNPPPPRKMEPDKSSNGLNKGFGLKCLGGYTL